MDDFAKKSLKDSPDNKRSLPKSDLTFATVGGVTFTLTNAEPGWQWSEDVKPVVGTDSCEIPHTLYEISGTLHVKMDDGSEMDINPGDVAHIPPGHQAWVVGDKPAVHINVTKEMADTLAM